MSEQATRAESSSSNSSPINIEDDRRHYVASPQQIELNCVDSIGPDSVGNGVSDDGNGVDEGEQAVPVSDDEDACDIADKQIQDKNLNDDHHIESQAIDPFKEVDEISIAGEIVNYLKSNRINIGELDTLEDLWGVCDAISAEHGGLPDSLLKDSFNIVLESYYNQAQNNSWQRQQIDKLIRIWKIEMLKMKSTPRATKFVSAPASDKLGTDKYNLDKGETLNEKQVENQTPVSEQPTDHNSQEVDSVIKTNKRQKREAQRRKRALAAIMGVGHVLSNARRKLATEDAELEVNEDEYGNFSIGGMPLSFENWGQFNKIKEHDIVHVGIQSSTKRLRSNSVSPSHSNGIPSQKQFKSDFVNMAEKYPTVREVEMPSNDFQHTVASCTESNNAGTSVSREESKEVLKTPITPPPREKDEGELSSSEPSDKPTSSEDESDNESQQQKAFMLKKNAALLKKNIENRPSQRLVQERRRAKKQDERSQGQQGVVSAQNIQQLLQKCFDLRGRIVRKLGIQQKAMFMDLLKQSMAGTLQQGVQNLQQQQAMASLMNTLNTSGIPGSSS